MIRDFGKDKALIPHPYGHSYHRIASIIWRNPEIKIKLVVQADDVCVGCRQLINHHCMDTISHRKDFISKEKFNDHIDRKILKVCGLKENDELIAADILRKGSLYLEEIEWIYEGNDAEHTLKRKRDFTKGMKYYKMKHQLIDF